MIFFSPHGYQKLDSDEIRTIPDMFEEAPANEVGEELDQQPVRENVVEVDSEIEMEEIMCSNCEFFKESDFTAGPYAPLIEKFEKIQKFQKKKEKKECVKAEPSKFIKS